MKINKSKTEGLWHVPLNSRLGKEPFGISWPKQYAIALGIAFPYHVQVGNEINFNEKLTKLSMYADDTTAFIRDDSSAVSLLTLLDQFGDLSGLKINKSKTEGLWLGPLKSRLGKEEPFGILWPKQYVFTLGIAYPYHVQVGNNQFQREARQTQKSSECLVK